MSAIREFMYDETRKVWILAFAGIVGMFVLRDCVLTSMCTHVCEHSCSPTIGECIDECR